MPPFRLGVDVGGTHTDLVCADDATGALLIEKVASTPDNPALAVLAGIERLVARGVDPRSINFFSHGTTVTTNALLELKGAPTGMLINRGFRAIQEVQTQARDSNPFDLNFRRPAPLVAQRRTAEIGGRLDHLGHEVEPLDEDDVRAAARLLTDAGVTSVAICFLFSYANPAHERRAAEILSEAMPAAHISLSSDVLPRVREWPRLSTTMVNAYLEPGLVNYADTMDRGLSEIGIVTPRRFLMQSNGGVMPLGAIAGHGRAVRTLLSGPAAGVQACAQILGQQQGWDRLVTMDMGGTSCDIAFIEDGVPLEVTEGAIADRPIDVPALDVGTISAGGGTLARVNIAGMLTVGPDSAGADPGPACYGRGGTEPTVTDADLVCGYLNPGFLLGGATSLDAAGARRAIEDRIAVPMGIDPFRAAAGIARLINARMADEIQVQAARRGLPLAEFTLVPFGGAGPVHAAMVAAELGIRRVLIPPSPGAFSALGLLCADVVHDYVRSGFSVLTDVDPGELETGFVELERQAKDDLAAEGLSAEEHHFERALDLRYAGQGYEIPIPVSGSDMVPVTATGLQALRERFDTVHRALHGHAAEDAAAEVVSHRLRVRVPVPRLSLPETSLRSGTPSPAAHRPVTFDGERWHDTPVYERDALTAGRLEGPAIIEQFDTTTVLPPGWAARVDRYANLVIEAEG